MRRVARGFVNFGNSCYFNSVVQALMNMDFFQKRVDIEKIASTSSLIRFAMSFPWFVLGPQQCAHETMLKMIDSLGLDEFFTTEYEMFKVCKCGIKDLGRDVVISHAGDPCDVVRKEEVLDGCECGHPKYRLISRLRVVHNVLMFGLNKKVASVPMTLGLRTSNGSESRYTLKSVIYHMGSPNGGHYYVNVVRPDGIYRIDDANVEKISKLEAGNISVALYENALVGLHGRDVD